MLITNNYNYVQEQDLKAKNILVNLFKDCIFLLPENKYSYYDAIRIKKINDNYVFDFVELKIRNKAYNSFFIELSKLENLKKMVIKGKTVKTIKELINIFNFKSNLTNLPEDTSISYNNTYYSVIVDDIFYEYDLKEIVKNKYYTECNGIEVYNPVKQCYELTKKWEIDIKYAKQFKF